MEEATLTLYRVKSCGFYDDAETHQFGTLSETMRSLLQWTQTLGSIGESCTYSENLEVDVLRAFCLDLRDIGSGTYLLATWNELPMVKDGVQLLQVDSQIGAADISAVQVDAMSLPGYPAYFVVDTRRQRVTNLRFEQRLNGSRQCQHLIQGFLASASPWCIWNGNDDDILEGYSQDKTEPFQIADGVSAKFSTSLVRIGGVDDQLRSRCGEIRKVIRRAVIEPEIELHKRFLDSAFAVAGLPVNNRLKADINFQYEFKTRLTPAKLDAMIAEHDNHTSYGWDDIGFVMAKESQKVHWLSGAIARYKIQIKIRRVKGGSIDIDSLAEYMRKNYVDLVEAFSE